MGVSESTGNVCSEFRDVDVVVVVGYLPKRRGLCRWKIVVFQGDHKSRVFECSKRIDELVITTFVE